MKVLQIIRKEFIKNQPLKGVRISACLHVTAETANLGICLRDGGAEVVLCGEKASDVRDTSLRLPPGVAGTIVEVRVFNRHGVDKDERALAIERAEIDRLGKDRDDEFAILNRNMTSDATP